MHTRAITKQFRVGAVVSRSGLVGLGAATCVGLWLGHGRKKTEQYINITTFFFVCMYFFFCNFTDERNPTL